MRTASYAPKVKPEEAANGGWQMHLRQAAQGETQKWRDNNAPIADNGWGNTQGRIDPYNTQQQTTNVTSQMQGVLSQINPFLEQQRQTQNAGLYEANNKALNNALLFRGQDNQAALQQIQAKGAAEYKAQADYNNSVAGYNDRQTQQYIAAKQANAQFGAADTQASAQRDAANAQAQAQKYVAEQAKEGGIFNALFGAVGNIASGFGGGRYW